MFSIQSEDLPVVPSHSTPTVVRKQRISTSEKLAAIAPGVEATVAQMWVEEFCHLFARRRSGGIVTADGNPRRWFASKWRIKAGDIIRHLLGDQKPPLAPKWFGVRSFPTSNYFAIDIDCDRDAPQGESEAELPERTDNFRPTRSTFEQRCSQARQSLLRLGIDDFDPTHVLRQQTPSGGVHLYVFLSGDSSLEEIKSVLQDSGLVFQKGLFEFFPSVSFGLRLPFGHLPGKSSDSTAWSQFLSLYRSGVIKRFDLAALRGHLELSGFKADQTDRVRAVPRVKSLYESGDKKSRRRSSVLSRQSLSQAASSSEIQHAISDEQKISSIADIEKLLKEGITRLGTRNKALQDLAYHHVFIKGMTAAEAEKVVVEWALNPRHISVDIQKDLQNGTHVVAKEIQRLCLWAEKKRDPNRLPTKSTKAHFSREEVGNFTLSAQHLPLDEREGFVVFLLHFLNFAKLHGRKSEIGEGWEAAPAVNSVIRKWHGCSQMKYKRFIETAIKVGLMFQTRAKWQNPRGKGNARTFFLKTYMATPDEQPMMTFEEALAKQKRMLSVIAVKQARQGIQYFS